MSDILNYLFGAVGFISAILAIYEIFSAKFKEETPSIKSEEIIVDDDYVVLSIKNDSDNNSLGFIANEYTEKYGATGEDVFWFKHNPKGLYRISETKYITSLFSAVTSAFLSLIAIVPILFIDIPDSSKALIFHLFVGSIAIALIVISIYFFKKSKESRNKMNIARAYINFLNKNKISIQMAFLQQKEFYANGLRRLNNDAKS